MRWIDGDRIRAAVPIRRAIEEIETALRRDGFPESPPRAHAELPAGVMLTMPCAGADGVGVKLATVAPGNRARDLPLINGVFVLFDGETLAPVATMDAAAITELRTAAVSAIATRRLARLAEARLVVFGTGAQARAHVDAMLVVCGIASLTVVHPRRASAEALAETLRADGIEAMAGPPEAVAEADVVCTCTTSATPVFDGSLLRAGAHVNAVGAFQPHARELDDETIRRARIVVETREAALAEAGDLLIPLREGVLGPDRILLELPALLRDASVQDGPGDITVFKSVGHAYEDLILASAVMRAVPESVEAET